MKLLCALIASLIAVCGWALVVADDDTINLVFDDTNGLGRTFEGIGGISGGGATSKLLVNYPQPLRDQILDYLFLPNFGASLQILKVEIGGDVQSTDGTEASHMHNSWEENYERGYEWWLMLEAKKRNPDIKIYSLPWGFPGWVGQGSSSPYGNTTVLADYVVRWINGAKTHYNITVDYVGIWNERPCNNDYVKVLRKTLNERGFQHTLIVASDNGWEFADGLYGDHELANAVHAVGCHYPGTWSSNSAKYVGKALWASEDYSTFNDEFGAGCWARILNQNYVDGLMTATIAWDLIASYYHNLDFFRDGLMTAVEPWSGHYVVNSPIWVTAHTTQFVSVGWKYLNHTAGVGYLKNGGSYVGLVSPTGNDLTIVIETMTHDHSQCIRPGLPWYTVSPQNVSLNLKGHFSKITKLNLWYSQLSFDGKLSNMFTSMGPVQVVNGMVNLTLGLDQIYTLTTLSGGHKGSHPTPPSSHPFPLPYFDDFEGNNLYNEPNNLAQQTGSFEVLSNGSNKFIRQMVMEWPLSWCGAESVGKAVTVIGDSTWDDLFIEIDFQFPTVNASNGIFVAARINQAGCEMDHSQGVFFFITSDNKYSLTRDSRATDEVTSGNLPSPAHTGWHKISLYVQGSKAYGAFDKRDLFAVDLNVHGSPVPGFAGIGTYNYGLADFDNLHIALTPQGAHQRKIFRKPSSNPLFFIKEH
ncbi:unnamed protein product [Candidula unifasciata]|uniref:galactosylceramidase n=1 Tax=Candidula unifasciata TaxID=100452 RepID=A0A8S3ZB16_9EUPU|nr:unnamed protein product [Candidula unifasciata]